MLHLTSRLHLHTNIPLFQCSLNISIIEHFLLKLGFSEREDLDDKIIQLEKACVRLADNNSNDDMDRLSLYSNRNCMDDDDVPDDCYIEPSNIFEPSIARRLAEADSIPSPCSVSCNIRNTKDLLNLS